MTTKVLYDLNMTKSKLEIKVNCGKVIIFKEQRDFDNVIEDMEFGDRQQYGGLCCFDQLTNLSDIYLYNSKVMLGILSHELGHAYFHNCGLSHIARNMGHQSIDELFALGCENLPMMSNDYLLVLNALDKENQKFKEQAEKAKKEKKHDKAKKSTKKRKA